MIILIQYTFYKTITYSIALTNKSELILFIEKYIKFIY
jgi:hypothetical protein